MKATCVVPTYQRHANIPRIVDSLLATPEIAEVVLWNNNYPANAALLSEIISRYRTDPVHLCVDAEHRNLFTYGRYKGAMQAQCGVICTQDDDVLVTADKWRRLFDAYESLAEPRLCCYLDAGHLKHGITNGRYEHAYKHGNETCKAWEMLVGWGAVFERDWVREIFTEYLALQPFDELSLRKADRIFTVMLETEHVVLQDEVEHLPGSHSADAVYRRKDHWDQNKAAIDRALWVLRTRP